MGRILGIGVDIENISRFRKLDLVNDAIFFNKIFTKRELKHCFSKKQPARHLAVRYAGKEAVVKALSGINKISLDYKNIEIVNKKNGAPMIAVVTDNVDLLGLQINISLSHCEDTAMAFVIINKK